MLALYLNDQPTDLLPTQQVKITTKAARAGQATSSYTLEITLPLVNSPHNQALLPLAQLATRSKDRWRTQRWRAHLLAGGRTIMRGVATLTRLTHQAASIQLLGGGAIYSHATAGADQLYIDELPLGYAYDDLGTGQWQHKAKDTQNYEANTNPCDFLNRCLNDDDYNARLYASSDHSPAVFYPTQNEDDTQRANPMAVFVVRDNQGRTHTRWSFCIASREGLVPISTLGQSAPLWAHYRPETATQLQQTPAVQPYLAFIIERVLWAIGLTLRPEDNALRQQPGLKNLFIVNGRHTLRYAEALPHWTVKTFFDNVQAYLGLTLYVDLHGRVRFGSTHDETPQTLQHIVDQYTCDYHTDTTTHTDRQLVTHYTQTWGLPEQNIHPDLYALATKTTSPPPPTADTEEAKRTIYLDANDPTHHARQAYVKRGNDYRLERVDILGAKLSHDLQRRTQTAAQLVPAGINYTCQRRLKGDNTNGYVERYSRVWLLHHGHDHFKISKDPLIGNTYVHPSVQGWGKETQFPILVTHMQVGPSERVHHFDLAERITQANPDLPKDTPHDTLTLAINTHGTAPHHHTRAFTYEQYTHLAEAKNYEGFPRTLLRGVDPQLPAQALPFSLYGRTAPSAPHAFHTATIADMHYLYELTATRQTNVTHTFHFVAHTAPSPDRPFIINGRRYACLSLETTYTHQGITSPIEGQFYELG